jgi:lipopolysaccharide transport system permease protein
MRKFSSSPTEIIDSIWRNRMLIMVSTKRDVLGRYRGSAFGMLWSFFNPLLMLSVYTFVFSEIFQAKWGGRSESKIEFALILFAGLICFNFFAECVSRAPELIVANPNYVKKVIFPLEIMPIIILSSALFHVFMSLLVWFIAYTLVLGTPHMTVLFLPLILIPYCFLILGLLWFICSLGVFLKDISQIISPSLTVLMFMTPLFYPISALPVKYQELLFLNPLTLVIEQFRRIIFWGEEPNYIALGTGWLISLVVAWLGFCWFQRIRKGFADVM